MRKRVLTLYIPLTLVILICLLPFLWMILTSIKIPQEIQSNVISYFPKHPTLNNYKKLLTTTDFVRYFWNSIVVAGGTAIFCLLVSFSAAYSFTRFKFKGSGILKSFLLGSQMFPKVLLLIPLFIILQGLRLLNTRTSLIFSYTSFTIPLVVWMLMGYFASIPKELDEAAMVDGCTRLGAMFRVIIPLALPGIAATFIYAFIYGWNELIFAVMFISSKSLYTLPVALNSFIGEYEIAWGMLNAGGVVTSLPVVILFMFLQRYLVQGLTAGAVKQ